jgi:hypothetical protein
MDKIYFLPYSKISGIKLHIIAEYIKEKVTELKLFFEGYYDL